MADKIEDDDAIAFARAAIGSVSALDLLILLRRDRRKPFRVGELVRELRSSELAVTRALEHLTQSGLVEEVPGGGYSCRHASQWLDSVCERVEAVYARRPVTLIRAILDAPDEKLRVFADAFRLSGNNK